MSAFYIASASAISNATLTVNFNASATTPRIWVVRVPDSSGTAALDAIGTYSQGDNTDTSLTQIPLTISGADGIRGGFRGIHQFRGVAVEDKLRGAWRIEPRIFWDKLPS